MLAGNVKNLQFYIDVDGTKLKFSHNDYLSADDWNTFWTGANYGIGVMLSHYDETAEQYSFLVTFPFNWKRKLVVSVYNPSASEANAVASISYDKIL